MRELRRCDFCGDDAAGAFEIVPPELEPTEDERRRVVLCADCKDRLQTLIEPLLARAGAGGESSAASATDGRLSDGSDDNGDRAGENESESGTVVASADESTPKRSRVSSPNATVSDAVTGESDDASDDNGANGVETAETAETDDDADAGGGAAIDSDSLLEDGITFERSEPADGGSDTSETESTTREETDGATESDDERSSDAETSTAAGRDGSSQPPAGYGKVLRLLRNREFPLQRSAVENLAAGAYDLESHEVDAIIDRAIERDEFVEKRGELRRPDA